MGEGVLLDDVDVTSGDSATGVDIVAEVDASHGLEGLRFTEIGVTTGNNTAGVDRLCS
jgi:hypothetical protein